MGNTTNNYALGRVMPKAEELEEVVLGALMIDREAVLLVSDILKPESFYNEANQNIYHAIQGLFSEGSPVDILTVTNRLEKTGKLKAAGGSVYLANLTNRVASAANVEYHARIIAQKHIRRKVIEVSANSIEIAFDQSTDDFSALELAEKQLFGIWNSYGAQGARQLQGPALEAFKTAEKATQSSGLTGIPSGLTTIDRITGGWQDTDLIILAARPGMGKTSLAMNMAYSAAKDFSAPVAVFSLEMSSQQLATRLICGDTGIDSHKVRNGSITDTELMKFREVAEKMASVPMFIEDTPGLSVFKMRAAARRLKNKYGIKMIVIDYLQLMEGENERGNREQAISGIARGLKHMAKELGVPVIALSQLSRAVEVRGGSKRPQLSDLRESGSIEQEADVVAFIYRPEYYGIMEDESGNSLAGIAEIIFAKHRNGKLGTVQVRFTDKTTTFCDIDEPDFEVPKSPQFPTPTMPRKEPSEDAPF